MNTKNTLQLNKIPETMLITLWAKSEELKRKNPLLVDYKAAEVIRQIDYDFNKFKGANFTQAGVCIRASLIDKEVQAFINKNPDAVVIQLGVGLDSRYERLGKPAVTHWFDLDLPESIALRKHFFEETDTYSLLEGSLFDLSWVNEVVKYNKPILIITEGVLMYYSREEIKSFFEELSKKIGVATFVFDMLAYALVGNEKKHDSLGKMGEGNRPKFQWSEKDSAVMESWNAHLQLEKEYFMSDYNAGRYPLLFRILYKIPYFYKRYNQRVVRLVLNK